MRFRPHEKTISAEPVGKLGLRLHSIGPTFSKIPNRKSELAQLFQLNSLKPTPILMKSGVETPPRLEKCPIHGFNIQIAWKYNGGFGSAVCLLEVVGYSANIRRTL